MAQVVDQRISYAESLLQHKNFRFRKRHGHLDMRDLNEVDVDRVMDEMDVDTLQRFLENLTFSEISEDDFRLYSEDSLVRLFRLAQLTLEYLLNVQDTLAINLNAAASKYSNLKREMKSMKEVISEREHTIEGLYNRIRQDVSETCTENTRGDYTMGSLDGTPQKWSQDFEKLKEHIAEFTISKIATQHQSLPFCEEEWAGDTQFKDCGVQSESSQAAIDGMPMSEPPDITLSDKLLQIAADQQDMYQLLARIGDNIVAETKKQLQSELDKSTRILLQSLECQHCKNAFLAHEKGSQTRHLYQTPDSCRSKANAGNISCDVESNELTDSDDTSVDSPCCMDGPPRSWANTVPSCRILALAEQNQKMDGAADDQLGVPRKTTAELDTDQRDVHDISSHLADKQQEFNAIENGIIIEKKESTKKRCKLCKMLRAVFCGKRSKHPKV